MSHQPPKLVGLDDYEDAWRKGIRVKLTTSGPGKEHDERPIPDDRKVCWTMDGQEKSIVIGLELSSDGQAQFDEPALPLQVDITPSNWDRLHSAAGWCVTSGGFLVSLTGILSFFRDRGKVSPNRKDGSRKKERDAK